MRIEMNDPSNFIGALLLLSESEGTGTALWRYKATREIFGLHILDKLKKSFLRTPVLSPGQGQELLFDDRAILPDDLVRQYVHA